MMKDLREAMEGKEVGIFLFYEFLGTAILSFGYNYMKKDGETDSFSYILFIVSLWSWDRSCANFNFGITFGETFANIKNVKAAWAKSFLIILMQLIGGGFGILLCLISSKVTHDNNTKTIWPTVPWICPNFGNKNSCN